MESRSILIVDDEQVVRSLCARLLVPLGYLVETAKDADEALTFFEKRIFDLVVTDFKMPGTMNGMELGQVLKSRFPATQIILMTAFPEVNSAVELLRTGGRDYLIKPFEPLQLVRSVTAAFERRTAA